MFISLKNNKMKVKQLLLACQQQVLNWNWEKEIYIPSDDEWNEWHQLFEWFTYLQEDIDECIEYSNTDKYDIERYHKMTDIILLW